MSGGFSFGGTTGGNNTGGNTGGGGFSFGATPGVGGQNNQQQKPMGGGFQMAGQQQTAMTNFGQKQPGGGGFNMMGGGANNQQKPMGGGGGMAFNIMGGGGNNQQKPMGGGGGMAFNIMGGGGNNQQKPMGGGGGMGGTTSGIANKTDFASVYNKMTRHPDGRAALEKLARVDWAYHNAKGIKVGQSGMSYMTNFPFQYMFYDNLVTWESDDNGLKKYVARSDKNKGQQSMNASMGGGMTGGFGGGNNMMGGGGGAFGGGFGGANNNMARQGQNMLLSGGGKSSFKQLWTAALRGQQQPGGISHEEFIMRAVQDHMKGPMGEYTIISEKLWAQAEANAVIKGVKVFPHPIVGFEQLKGRIQNQRERADQLMKQAERLKKIAAANKATLVSTKLKIEAQKRKQLDLRGVLIQVMKEVERLHHWNLPTKKNDILFRERMSGLMAELMLPHRFSSQLTELESQMANQNLHQESQQLHLSPMDKERVFDFLSQQQRGLHELTEIVRKDVRDLIIMRNRSIMEIKQAQKEQNGNGMRY